MKYLKLVIPAFLLVITANASASTVILDSTVNLGSELSTSGWNFRPQGLGYDASANELLFAQQGSQVVYRTDLSGNVTGSVSTGLQHTTSVAADANNYYVSDYTGNTSYPDLYTIDKASGAKTTFSSEVAAYGGYPIDVRGGNLYRTENTNNYNWGSLNEIRVSSLLTPDVTSSVFLDTTFGIGDMTVDHLSNTLWLIDYSANAYLRQFDLSSGLELASYDFGLDGLTAGLTFANNKLYYYDWDDINGSTLNSYSVSAVPVPAAAWLFGSALLGFFGFSRRKANA